MTDFIIQAFTIAFAIATCIITVTAGRKLIRHIGGSRPVYLKAANVKNFLEPNSAIEVTTNDGKVIKGQNFCGLAQFKSSDEVPFDFQHWFVLESEQGRTFIRPSAVRMIKECNPTKKENKTLVATGDNVLL
ncbi:MAG: hypothetical protein ACK46A_07660 [Akkermansiaceae bacterium]|jgi:hypothetical protein